MFITRRAATTTSRFNLYARIIKAMILWFHTFEFAVEQGGMCRHRNLRIAIIIISVTRQVMWPGICLVTEQRKPYLFEMRHYMGQLNMWNWYSVSSFCNVVWFFYSPFLLFFVCVSKEGDPLLPDTYYFCIIPFICVCFFRSLWHTTLSYRHQMLLSDLK